MRAALVTMIVAACCGALAPGAAAGWEDPAPLATGSEPIGNGYDVAYDGAGRGTAVWLQGGLAQGLPDVARVMTADRPAGAGWQGVQRLSLDTRPSGTTSPGDPGRVAEGAVRVAVTPRGDALVVWVEHDHASPGGNSRVRARLRPAGGAWGPTRDVSGLLQVPVNLDDVAFSADGRALVLWRADALLQAGHLPAGAADWDAPEDVSVAGDLASGARLAIGADGAALVAWRHRPAGGGAGVVRTRVRTAGGTWGTPADVPSPGTNAGAPQVALDAAGNATVLFADSNGSNSVVRSSRRAAGATSWPTAAQVSASGGSASYLALVVEPDGDALAAWSRADGTDTIAQAARRPASGAWQTPQGLSAAGRDAIDVTLALDDDGTATAVWVATDLDDPGQEGVLQAARRSPAPDRTWGATEELDGQVWKYTVPVIGVAPGGNATVAAKEVDGATLSTVDFDAARPAVGSLSAPATALTGAPLSFAVEATGAARVTWDFGDGGTAEGATATHAYAAPGTYTVSVRASDGFGAPATASATVVVADPPAPDPGGGGDSGGGGGTGGGGAVGGGAPPATGPAPTPGTPTPAPLPARLRLQLAAPAQRLATVARRRTVALTCTLPTAGRCTVRVTVDAATARALGLRVAKGAKRVTLGTARATVQAGRKRTLRLRVPSATARRLAARRRVVLALAAEGVASDGRRAAATATLTLRR